MTVSVYRSVRARLMLGAACALMGAAAQATEPSCSTVSTVTTCTQGSGSFNTPIDLDAIGGSAGASADSTSLTNEGTFNVTAGSDPFTLRVTSTGADGVDDGDAGNGGFVTVDNSGALTLTRSNAANSLIVIDARSIGGNADSDNTNNGSPGGDGGAGSNVTISNAAAITLGPSLPEGGIGIYGLSQGGTGGEANTELGINQPGGNGGAGGTVSVTNKATITMGSPANPITQGSLAWGIRAESHGGGGDRETSTESTPASGAGGDGGTVTVTNTALISLHVDGTGSTSGGVQGVSASSAGGQGAISSYDFNNGGQGGDGGEITVDLTSGGNVDVSSVEALTDGGAGVGAQSQGGNAGEGSKQNSDGGEGGQGGGGGSITVNVTGASITTQGDRLVGVLAKSLGGTGGRGDAQNDSSGGRGGSGGAIQINLEDGGKISTTGDNAYGILGQSIGGLGGEGGNDASIFGQPGSAGAGGNASAAGSFSESGTTISTTGDFAAGIAFQSIGGGGGVGNDFVGVLGSGGNGGNGGNGLRAAINSGSTVTTTGDHAYGLLAQAISGSGGAGGIAAGIVSLGGDGGSGGTGGTGEILNSGNITTQGYAAHGMVLQSIAGGGGAAGPAGGLLVSIGGTSDTSYTANGGAVDLSNTARVTTKGDAAVGILAQSIGGGGGTGAATFGLVSVGGSGSAGGSGGSVTLATNGTLGTVSTAGEFAQGVLLQSIGGGGGNGGNAFDFTTEIPAVAIGGGAAGGGAGGKVTLDNSANPAASSITTTGDAAVGLLVQSIGGGGGSGGDATGASFQSQVNLKIGGSGATSPANGGAVTIDLDNLSIVTTQARSAGMLVQSIGGGGGSGGAASGFDASLGYAVGVSVGGAGGAGGSGGTMSTHLTGARITSGKALPSGSEGNQPTDTFGLVVQSIGGGGGNGGSATADDVAVLVPTGEDVSFAVSVAVAVGGGAGAAGNGGSASVTLDGSSQVSTIGQGSHGVVVQSIGGGGGNGGDSSSLSSTIGDEDTLEVDVSVAVGRDGGSGGTGGPVTVTLGSSSSDASKISTADDYANAILAQSIGGGGGNAGVGSSNTRKLGGATSADVDVGVGGVGASGGTGGTVQVTHSVGSSITTTGSGSRGIVAQSIGGGGGTSQGTNVVLGGEASDYSADITVNVGLQGGMGGTGNTVTINSHGGITTSGGDADAILAQSIGGGGGLGGSIGNDASADPQLAGALELLEDDDTTYTFTTSVGGKGGTGNTGGAVNLTSASAILTGGDWADGIVAQSIGGGGGVGGTATASGSDAKADTEIGVGGSGGSAGNGGAAAVTVSSSISTAGYSAYGVLAQSIGGGGGQGGDGSDSSEASVAIGAGSGVGGSGGASGDGGTVKIATPSGGTAIVSTAGDDALGVVAQSIGGGGGAGGAGSSDSGETIDVEVTVGGSSGSSGAGGSSTIDGRFQVTTGGDRAFGMVAQSIGGGGGIGGTASSDNVTSVSVGGQGGAGGSGGVVGVTLNAGSSITTSGKGAHALVAQSIGGGGGIGGDASGGLLNLTPEGSLSGSGGGSGVGVTLSVDADIQTTGAGAFGILAQSIGGGGGFGGDAGGAFAGNTDGSSPGDSGNVTISQSGSVQATGENSIGIFAQSIAPDSIGTVAATVNGTVVGGSGSQGVGVHIDNGQSNTLTIGSTGSVSAGSGVAIRYTALGPASAGFDLTVTNDGTISGSVENPDTQAASSPSAAITVDNRGRIERARRLEADVRNRGTLAVGEPGVIDTTRITHDLVQTAAGRLIIGLDLVEGAADLLSVDGDATLDGKVEVEPITLLPARRATFLEIGGALQGRLEGEPSPIFRYAIETAPTGATISVASADFETPLAGGTGNQREVAGHLQEAWDLGGTPALGRLFVALDSAAATGADTYAGALDELSLGVAAAPAARRQATMLGFADSLTSCPELEDETAIVREGSCFWARVAGSLADQDDDDGASGFDQDGVMWQLGAQSEVGPDWFLGVAVAYLRDWFDSDDGRSSSDGNSVLAGVVLKRELGPWLLGMALTGGYGWYDTTRKIDLDGVQDKADSDPDLQNVGLRARAAYSWGAERLYLRPYLDLDAIYTRQPSYDESGAGDLDLDVDSADQWSLVATPSVEVGGRVALEEGYTLRPYARAGVSFSSQSNWTTEARLAAAPSGIGTFDSNVPMDDVVGRIGAGLQLLGTGQLSAQLQYDGELSENVTSHTGSLRLTWRF